MATRTIFATVKITLDAPNADEITDEQVEDFVENTLYDFRSTKGVEVLDTEWINTEY